MAVLGAGGRLQLRREAPAPLVLGPGALNRKANAIEINNQDYWSGDAVTLTSLRGLPLVTAQGVPQCAEGFASYYGSTWYLGSNRDHITSETAKFYKNNTADFYAKAPVSQSITVYIYRDKLDRVSFYTDHASALNGSPDGRLALGAVDWGQLIIAPSGSSDYDNLILTCAGDIGDYRFSDAQDEVTLASICDDAPTYQKPAAGSSEYDDADIQPRGGIAHPLWQVACDIRNWSLELSAPNIETTAVGEKFGEGVKSLVTGGGSIDFLIERHREDEGHVDSMLLLQLLTMTEQGCKAAAQFWMIDREGTCDLLPGDLYYDTELLVTNVAINLRPTEVVAGTAQFVTTGSIALKQGTN